jgi:DNA-binding PadR family transcriptional regulator
MGTKTIYDYVVNKDSCNSETRKYIVIDGIRIGPLERLILDFASKHVFITAASVREYLKQQGSEASLKRIHDALQRLLKKGIVEKISRGIYRLTEYGRKILNTLLSQKMQPRKETESKAFRGDGFYRARLHMRGAGSFEDLVRQLYAVRRVVECALNYFKQVLGKRRFYEVVRGVSVICVDTFVGGHGVSLFRGRSVKRPLVNLDYFYSLGLLPREIGVDVFVAVSGVGKPAIKIYFG